MERLLRLTEFWSRLPAFRAVAETEHLPSAAERLRVTPSALCRTIGLLERDLGHPLFLREGKRIRLSPRGERFLAAVRDSMRIVDDGVDRLSDSALVGPFHLAVAGPFNFTLPAVFRRLREECPGLVPHLHNYAPAASGPALLRGELDLVVTPDPLGGAGLEVEPAGTLTHGIYCGRGHPLYRARKVSLERLAEHDFVAPLPGESSRVADGWPPGRERRITLFVQQLFVALEACASGDYLAVFPDRLAGDDLRYPLRRLPISAIRPTELFAVRRRRLVEDDAAAVVRRLIAEHWAD